jgi:hypothetical protein
MKFAIAAIAASASVGIGLAACGSGSGGAGAALHSAATRPSTSPPAPTTPAPTTPAPTTPAPTTPAPTAPTAPTAPAPSATQQGGPPSQPPASAQPNVTDPWAVVSAYYGDIESGNYAQAWSLINDGATTGQSYQQFVNGFTCTGAQQLTEIGESGDQVTFNLAATNACTGQVQYFSGTDTVQNGTIVAANVHQTG